MKTEEQIQHELKRLKEKRLVLQEVLTETENENELERGYLLIKERSFSKKIALLEWVLDIDLPF